MTFSYTQNKETKFNHCPLFKFQTSLVCYKEFINILVFNILLSIKCSSIETNSLFFIKITFSVLFLNVKVLF